MGASEKETVLQRKPPIELPDRLIENFCSRWQITELTLFGSALREDFRPDSDVDILVTFERSARWSLLDMARMEQELQGLLGRKIDLVERRAVELSENYIRRRHILESAEPQYVAR
jgi:predicted nucleotidyltransferase